MKQIIDSVFALLGTGFNQINKLPIIGKLNGYKTVVGFLGLAVVAVLKHKGIGDEEVLKSLNLGLMTWTGLALNSKGRE